MRGVGGRAGATECILHALVQCGQQRPLGSSQGLPGLRGQWRAQRLHREAGSLEMAVWETQVTGWSGACCVEVGGTEGVWVSGGGCPNPGANSGKPIDMQTAWKALV